MANGAATALESVLSRDRVFVVAGLVGVSLAAWAYSVSVAGHFHEPLLSGPWTPWSFAMVFIMWSIMMVAMMVPSASPMVLTYATLQRTRRRERTSYGGGGVAAFVLGYIIAWTAFSSVATVAQWGLQRAALISPAGASTSVYMAGTLLVVAGIFQWTPWKRACLTHCRSPFAFLMTSWREGPRGALVMGLEHGVFCVGCCWALMALMFVAGVMNIFWLAAIAIFVLLEKVVPAGDVIGRLAGAAMTGWGIYVIWLGLQG